MTLSSMVTATFLVAAVIGPDMMVFGARHGVPEPTGYSTVEQEAADHQFEWLAMRSRLRAPLTAPAESLPGLAVDRLRSDPDALRTTRKEVRPVRLQAWFSRAS